MNNPGLLSLGYTEAEADEILRPDHCGHIGFPHFSLSNNNANIKRIRDRIARIEAEQTAPTIQGWTFDGGEVVANREADRLQILFDEKPGEEQRARLKKAAFKWSPRFGAWQRQLTRNAVYAAQNVLGGIASA